MRNPMGSDVTSDDRRRGTMEALMRQESFTPQELAALLDMPLSHITHEAFAGHLKADIVSHDIVAIHRSDILDWLAKREGRG